MAPFVIFSTSRSGSTTLNRALNLFPGVRAANEPSFYETLAASQVRERVAEILSEYIGFKHVFDPSGFPFCNLLDGASIAEMESEGPLWIELNSAVLNFDGLRIVFLRRRSEFDRVVSELIGRASGEWGNSNSEVSTGESDLYKEKVSQIPMPPLDEGLVHWYLENMPPFQERLRNGIATNAVLDVWYEDLFGEDVDLPQRIKRFAQIVEFLEIPAAPQHFGSRKLSLLLAPTAKLNGASVFDRIPNYWTLRAQVALHGARAIPRWLDASHLALRLTAPGQMISSPPRMTLRVDQGNVALRTFPSDEPNRVRVAITRITTDTTFDVQINVPISPIEANATYTVRFRARADQSRTIYWGVAQAHAPWAGLGGYEKLELSNEWRNFEREFIAAADDDQPRLHFDLGGCAVAVELGDLTLSQPQ